MSTKKPDAYRKAPRRRIQQPQECFDVDDELAECAGQSWNEFAREALAEKRERETLCTKGKK